MEEVNVNEKIREIISYHKLSDRLTLNAFTDISADWLLRNKGPMLISDIKPDPNIERMERLVDTIATLQGTINEQMKTNQLLTEKLKKIEGELAMLKNERNVG